MAETGTVETPQTIGGRLRHAFGRYATFDARAFAIVRVYVGLIVFGDLLRRFPTRYLFFAGDGLLPPPIESYVAAPRLPTLIDPHASHALVDAFFAFGFVVATLLIVGLFTRVVSVVVWVFVLSLINRTRLLTTGGEILFAFITLYLIFAPQAKRWSLDARRDRARGVPAPRTLVSGTGLVIVLQWAIMYAVTGLAKHGPSWRHGTAISEAVRAGYVASPIGAAMSDMPPVLDHAFSWSALVIELSLPLLLLTPWRRKQAHAIAAVLIFSLHFGIAVMLNVGMFSPLTWTIVPLLVPSEAYDWLEARFARAPISRTVLVASRGQAIARVVLVLLAVANFVEFGLHSLTIHNGPYARPEIIADIMRPLALAQNWVMFAPNPPRYSDVVVVSARTADGRYVDPLRQALSGKSGVRTRVPTWIEPNHLVASYIHRVSPFDMLERSRLEGLTRLIGRHHLRTGRKEDRVVQYRITRLFVPTRTRFRFDPRAHAVAHSRALMADASHVSVRVARVRGHLVHAPFQAADGVVAERGTDARTSLAAIFDSRCGALVFELSRPATVRALLFSASSAGTYEIFVGDAPAIRVESTEEEGHLVTHVLDVPGVHANRIRVLATGGPGVASVSELVVFDADVSGLRTRAARERPTAHPIAGNQATPLYEPLIFGPAVGSRCAGTMETIPPLVAADTALPL